MVNNTSDESKSKFKKCCGSKKCWLIIGGVLLALIVIWAAVCDNDKGHGKYGGHGEHHGGKYGGKKARHAGMIKLLTYADSNADYLVSQNEIQALFAQLDSNGDGMLSNEIKLAKHKGKKSRKGKQRLDSNGDGMVSKDEFMAMFDKYDANQDGVINIEIVQIHELMRGK